MKMPSAACLLLVAMATTAIVVPIREYLQPASVSQTLRDNTGRAYACERAPDGLARAACSAPRDGQQVDGSIRSPSHRSPRLWV